MSTGLFSVKGYTRRGDNAPWIPVAYAQFSGKSYREVAAAADDIERWFNSIEGYGYARVYAEIFLNGDTKPHTTLFLLDEDRIGVYNDENAKWPMYYSGDDTLAEWPEGYSDRKPGEVREDENETPESEENSGQDEEDDSDYDDDNSESDLDDYDSDSEDFTSDEGDDEDADQDDSDEASESDDEGSVEGDSENESDNDQEDEMPRLTIFAKMRGPKGWRKRAEAEDLLERNVFGFKIGVLNPDEELTNAQREKDIRVVVDFIEEDAKRGAGTLKIKLPEGMTIEDFKPVGKKGNTFAVEVPYTDE